MTETFSAAAPDTLRLRHLGVIRAQGVDAATFLHGQLSHDFLLQTPAQARLAAYCSPKGRMLASFIVLRRSSEELLLVCPHDVLEAALKRLKMFVLRAKCTLTDASSDFALYGLAGAEVPAALQAPWQVLEVPQAEGAALAVSLYPIPSDSPSPSLARALWLAPAGSGAPAGAQLPAWWQWSEVMSAVPLVGAALAEQFVPQMLNYESVDGVSFKKGCYPGQEVVARSQFRGTLKRRAYLVQAAQALSVGDAVLDAEGQEVGSVVQAATHPDTGVHNAIIAIQTSAAEQPLTANTIALTALPLPYSLRNDI